MALILGAGALEGALGMREAVDLLEMMSRHEAAGRTVISPRLNSPFEGGWMRMMFAADYESGFAATKVFHMIRGVGVRYVVSLYRLNDGELLAVIDGRLITDLRTGAASGVAARHLRLPSTVTVGLIGSGHQSRMQLEALASQLHIAAASVYSPNAEHRGALAREMTRRLDIPVTAVDSAEAAARDHEVVVAATNAVGAEPVLRRRWLTNCRLVCAVGSTRPESVEVDEATFGDAEVVIVDSLLAAEEAGDLRRAVKSGRLALERQLTLAQLVERGRQGLAGGYAVFKSVGTGLQDLALAARCYELLGARSGLSAVPDVASLKQPVSAQPAAPAAGDRARN
ncbi:MAG: ornithine cyclodeaminase family protein [Betaproteobacteria bacterium]|nr:ornithine cyclodeaminase family protein [Betaproteobacteria bacterium]